MPLVVGTPAPVVPPPPPTPRERLGMSWTAPDGTVWPLNDRSLGYWVKLGFVGWGAAPVTVTTDPNPRGGATVRHVQPEARLITMPLHIKASMQSDFIALWRELARAFTQTRRLGPGVLSVKQPDGSMRQIKAYYQDGFENTGGLGWKVDQPVLTLFCEDPYWQDPAVTVIRREYTSDSDTFFSPFPHVSSSQTLGDTTATNLGDVEAWPEWTITGPASGLTATNNETGEQFTLTPVGGTLGSGDTVTITTDPPAVIGPDGSSWVGTLDWPDAVLWSLAPGDNSVTFSVTGSGAGTSIELRFNQRYETV